jgi:hypothetical protein
VAAPRRSVAFAVRSNAAATVKVTAKLTASGKTYPLKSMTRAIPADRLSSLRLKPTGKAAKAAGRALAARKRVKVKLKVTATGAAGQTATASVTVELRR